MSYFIESILTTLKQEQKISDVFETPEFTIIPLADQGNEECFVITFTPLDDKNEHFLDMGYDHWADEIRANLDPILEPLDLGDHSVEIESIFSTNGQTHAVITCLS